MVGLPVGRFTRVFLNYSYEVIDIEGLDALLGDDPADSERRPHPGSAVLRRGGPAAREQFTPSLVHNTVDNPYTPRSGMKLHEHLPAGRRSAGRHRQLLPAGRGSRLLHPPPAAHGAGDARPDGVHQPLRRHQAAPVLPALLPGRRDPDPRVQHPHGGPPGREQPRPGRQQVRAVQRRVLHRHRRAVALPVLLRREARPSWRTRRSTSGSSGPRRAPSCASSCPC